MIEKATSPANIQAMLQTLRAYQNQASGAGFDAATDSLRIQPGAAPGIQPSSKAPGFGELVSNAVSQVNQTQVQARALQDSFDRGENVPLTDVVLAMQKSSIAFEATLQVRNKVLKAYEDILNMPV